MASDAVEPALSLPETALASCAGSLVARCLCHPLDTVKAKLQAAAVEQPVDQSVEVAAAGEEDGQQGPVSVSVAVSAQAICRCL